MADPWLSNFVRISAMENKPASVPTSPRVEPAPKVVSRAGPPKLQPSVVPVASVPDVPTPKRGKKAKEKVDEIKQKVRSRRSSFGSNSAPTPPARWLTRNGQKVFLYGRRSLTGAQAYKTWKKADESETPKHELEELLKDGSPPKQSRKRRVTATSEAGAEKKPRKSRKSVKNVSPSVAPEPSVPVQPARNPTQRHAPACAPRVEFTDIDAEPEPVLQSARPRATTPAVIAPHLAAALPLADCNRIRQGGPSPSTGASYIRPAATNRAAHSQVAGNGSAGPSSSTAEGAGAPIAGPSASTFLDTFSGVRNSRTAITRTAVGTFSPGGYRPNIVGSGLRATVPIELANTQEAPSLGRGLEYETEVGWV
eukprot:TRINITY_DN40451_c0_g1_i1.p1 TRINITY_DN40451_c0_g1~~TRINITY_DN40451_c0_g1_i1.p1  ORF type:complete len:377 (+),score=26.28 TRINITY_DN40451_c0_g1_i1:31-1131(+)